MTVVNERLLRAAAIWSSSANASAVASRSAGPLPTVARSTSELTTSAFRKCSAAHVDFPEPAAPARTTMAGSGSRASVIGGSLAADGRPSCVGCGSRAQE